MPRSIDRMMSKDGRRTAFMEEVSRHQGIIHKIARLYFANPVEREDYFQDVLLNGWRSYPDFAGRSAFSTWLYKVALNTALMRLRSARRAKWNLGRAAAEAASSGGVPGVSRRSQADAESRVDASRALGRALETLDDLEKSIVLLRLDELSYREIAEITGLTETHVGVRINRIKEKLRARMAPTEDAHGI